MECRSAKTGHKRGMIRSELRVVSAISKSAWVSVDQRFLPEPHFPLRTPHGTVRTSMATIELETRIRAPIGRVFDLARSIDLHTASTSGTGERAVAGVTTGLIGAGEEVTWRARHFGIWQHLTSRITAFEPPVRFRDSMVRGAFRSMDHDHCFAFLEGVTVMTDRLDFTAPLGLLGRLAERTFLEGYLRRFLVGRNRILRLTAESGDWRRYLAS